MFLRIDNLRVYYEATGSGFPVLLLHGWGANSGTMRPISKALVQSGGARSYALDFPGFGFSDPPPTAWGVEEFTSLVLRVLDELGLERVDLVAHSFGGRVAIELAAHHAHRVKRLLLTGGAGIRPRRTAGYYARVYTFKAAKLAARVLPGPLGRSLHTAVAGRVGSADYRGAGQMRPTLVKVLNQDLTPLLPSVRCPTLLVWGERDDATPLQDAHLMRQLIPNSRLEVISGAGHYSFLDSPGPFSAHLLSFLGDTG